MLKDVRKSLLASPTLFRLARVPPTVMRTGHNAFATGEGCHVHLTGLYSLAHEFNDEQVVRADLKELWDLDLKGAPYAYTPFCSSREETLGYQFWRGGFWETHLMGRPYHISALYVVDLKKFRRMAVGDSVSGCSAVRNKKWRHVLTDVRGRLVVMTLAGCVFRRRCSGFPWSRFSSWFEKVKGALGCVHGQFGRALVMSRTTSGSVDQAVSAYVEGFDTLLGVARVEGCRTCLHGRYYVEQE